MGTNQLPHAMQRYVGPYEYDRSGQAPPVHQDTTTQSLQGAFSGLSLQSHRPPQQQHGFISGYLIDQAKDYTGERLALTLTAQGININNLPPFGSVNENLQYVEHGVIKIKNVSSKQHIEVANNRKDPIHSRWSRSCTVHQEVCPFSNGQESHTKLSDSYHYGEIDRQNNGCFRGILISSSCTSMCSKI